MYDSGQLWALGLIIDLCRELGREHWERLYERKSWVASYQQKDQSMLLM